MINRWRWLARQLSRRLWIRATLISALAFLAALLASLLNDYIPLGLESRIGADSVDRILEILASSMLAVTTFSLSVMVNAYSTVTSNVTPRAARLLTEDATTQNVLAVFIGSFLFSLVGIVGRSAGLYGENGRVLLFLVTIAVLVLIVVTILRWIDHLTKFGRVSEATDRVERAARDALETRVAVPFLGGRSWHADPAGPGDHTVAVTAVRTGYVKFVDMPLLNALAEDGGGRIFIQSVPGSFVHAARPLAFVEGLAGPDVVERLRAAFRIGNERSFDQDPRYGLSVLAEIASRALSPGVNDAGTAIDVIGRAVRVLSVWAAAERGGAEEAERGSAQKAVRGGGQEPVYPRLFVPELPVDALFYDVFTPIARDGAAIAEVQIRLQKAFRALAGCGDARFRAAALKHAGIALDRALAAMGSADDRRRVEAAAGPLQEAGAGAPDAGYP